MTFPLRFARVLLAVTCGRGPPRSAPGKATGLFTDVLAVLGTQEQRKRLFWEVLDGGRLGNAQAERGGKHAQDLKTRLYHDPGGDLRLAGTKYYTTGSLTARWLGVTALDEAGQLVLAFVRRDAPGMTLDTDWNVMGQRATVSGSAVFADVQADLALVVPYAGAFAVPQQLGARTQLVHAAIQVGIAGGALRDAGWFVRETTGSSELTGRQSRTSPARAPGTVTRAARPRIATTAVTRMRTASPAATRKARSRPAASACW